MCLQHFSRGIQFRQEEQLNTSPVPDHRLERCTIISVNVGAVHGPVTKSNDPRSLSSVLGVVCLLEVVCQPFYLILDRTLSEVYFGRVAVMMWKAGRIDSETLQTIKSYIIKLNRLMLDVNRPLQIARWNLVFNPRGPGFSEQKSDNISRGCRGHLLNCSTKWSALFLGCIVTP